jgi:hypothetical protein
MGSWKIMPMRPPRIAHLLGGKRGEVFAVEENRARCDFPHRLRQEPHDRQGGDTLATARLPDDAERAAPAHGEAHAVDGGQRACVGVEGGDEVTDLEHHLAFAGSRAVEVRAGGKAEGHGAGLLLVLVEDVSTCGRECPVRTFWRPRRLLLFLRVDPVDEELLGGAAAGRR